MKLSEIKMDLDSRKTFLGQLVKVKKYISIHRKQVEIEGLHTESIDYIGLIDNCITDAKNGYKVINPIDKILLTRLSIVKLYTDIELDDLGDVDIYDFIMESGIWNYVVEQIPVDEYEEFIEMLDDSIDNRLKSENSIESTLRGLSNSISEKMNDFTVKNLDKMIKGVLKDVKKNPEVLDRMKDVFNINQAIK